MIPEKRTFGFPFAVGTNNRINASGGDDAIRRALGWLAHGDPDALEAGMIWVNSENVRHLPTPFGGVKASGIGRDGGDWSFEFYMEQKHVGFAMGAHPVPRLGA